MKMHGNVTYSLYIFIMLAFVTVIELIWNNDGKLKSFFQLYLPIISWVVNLSFTVYGRFWSLKSGCNPLKNRQSVRIPIKCLCSPGLIPQVAVPEPHPQISQAFTDAGISNTHIKRLMNFIECDVFM
jgi:hypothetical protein